MNTLLLVFAFLALLCVMWLIMWAAWSARRLARWLFSRRAEPEPEFEWRPIHGTGDEFILIRRK